jgi:2-methylisocitrate lyase-like PEP mutase family enzyme
MTLTDTFRALHRQGTFVMPNPWDRGSARILADLGFKALATTSAGFARSIGKNDQQVTRDELVTHVAELTAVLDIPLNVDSECLFPDDPGGITETVRLLAEAGASGCSIEDFRPMVGSIISIGDATEAVREAAAACREHGVVLTARCENLLYAAGDLDDTIARLIAYREAGAEVLYPPGLVEAADITRVVTEVGAPVNVLAFPGSPPIDQLAELGVRRVSTGGALQTNAYKAMRRDAEALLALQPD